MHSEINWIWEENSVLNHMSAYTSPRDIFMAVCHELGRYFALMDAKYTKS